MDYTKAQSLFATCKNPQAGKPLENNTRLFKRDRNYAIQLHQTDVVMLRPDGSVVLNSGNWRTVTTKARINEYAPIITGVYSVKGSWEVNTATDKKLFADGMRITCSGKIIGGGAPSIGAKETRLRKAIGDYSKAYIEKLYAGEIGTPGAGDCFGCQFVPVNGNVQKEHGFTGGDHIREHLKEKYYVPSLILRANEAMGASLAMKNDTGYLLKMAGWETAGMFCKDGRFIRPQLQRALRRYCLREVGLSY